MFSPPVLIRRPAPSPRSSQATRLVTSNAPSAVCAGFTAPWTHATSAGLSPVYAEQASQFPPPPGGGGPGDEPAAVWNTCVADHGPLCVGSNAYTRQKYCLPETSVMPALTLVWPGCSDAFHAPT